MNTIVVETTGYARGLQVLDQRLTRVRVGDEGYRAPKPGASFEATLAWLQAQGYILSNTVRPKQAMGTVVVRYFYEKS